MISKKDDDDDNDDLPSRTGRRSPQRIPQHKHCVICHKAIPIKEQYCSEDCKTQYKELERKRRTWWIMMYVIIFAFLILAFLSIRG